VSGVEGLEHRNVRLVSLINLPLWDKARWTATVYIIFEDPKQPPLMALGFTDAQAGKAIFGEWHEKIGRIDRDEILRLSIITGIDQNKPFSYKVVMGVNLELRDSATEFVIINSRINRMDPPDHKNLSNFLERYKNIGWYVLMPAEMKNGMPHSDPFWNYGISIRKLAIRPAWQIGEHDLDAVALEENDEPIIPDGIDDPPVLRLLKRRRRS
jgi:hypothetical protein